jgi:hypothetical protein
MHLSITMNLDEAPWRDLDGTPDEDCGIIERIGLLPNGTTEGKAIAAVVIRFADGTHAVGQVKWGMLKAAVHSFEISPVTEEFLDENGE